MPFLIYQSKYGTQKYYWRIDLKILTHCVVASLVHNHDNREWFEFQKAWSLKVQLKFILKIRILRIE